MLKNISKISAVLIIIILIIWGIVLIDINYSQRLLRFPYPLASAKARNAAKYFCKAIAGTRIDATAKNTFNIKKGIYAESFKARDRFFMEIDADKLYLIRKTFFKSYGNKKGDLFAIIYNDEHRLMAIDSGYLLGPVATIIVFDKDTGIADLTKISTNNVFTNNPGTESYCLKCDPR